MIDLYSGDMQLAVNVIMKYEDNDNDMRYGLLDTLTDNFGA